jgi:hypothetical protein
VVEGLGQVSKTDGDDVVDLDAARPHWQGPMWCVNCGHRWRAVVGPIEVRDGEVGGWDNGEWFAISHGGWECPACGSDGGEAEEDPDFVW